MPEQFAKIGDRIVAIPMISEEQQKQTVLEEKSSIVNENTFGTEGLVLDAKEVPDHAAKGGIFGVEKSEWKAMLERQNPLKTAEMSVEDDYGMIDGIINNGSKEKESSEKREKSSIMDRLKAAKSSKPQVKSAPSKEKKSERDL